MSTCGCANPILHQAKANRRVVLQAVNIETNSWGGGAADTLAPAFCSNPCASNPTDYSYLGCIRLSDCYVSPAKPNSEERHRLWKRVVEGLGKPGTEDPGGWDGKTTVGLLQRIAESA